MSTAIHLTAQAIFAEAFGPARVPRSEAYRKGVIGQLRYRMEEAPDNVCPYKAGSAEFDAFWAGVGEAWTLLERHKCDRRHWRSAE